jgi:hypothetical protein
LQAPQRRYTARRIYTLKDDGKGTTLIVDSDAVDEYKESFEKAFPKALQRVVRTKKRGMSSANDRSARFLARSARQSS